MGFQPRNEGRFPGLAQFVKPAKFPGERFSLGAGGDLMPPGGRGSWGVPLYSALFPLFGQAAIGGLDGRRGNRPRKSRRPRQTGLDGLSRGGLPSFRDGHQARAT